MTKTTPIFCILAILTILFQCHSLELAREPQQSLDAVDSPHDIFGSLQMHDSPITISGLESIVNSLISHNIEDENILSRLLNLQTIINLNLRKMQMSIDKEIT